VSAGAAGASDLPADNGLRQILAGPALRLLANPLAFTHNSRITFLGGFMSAVRLRNFLSVLLATAFSVSMLPTAGEAYTPEQQQACQPDAFRLCGPEIPDVDRVTACMIRHRAELSPPCRVFFRASGPERLAPAGRPLSIRPTTERKPVHVKPHKAKKPAKPAAT
jgi:hypothetical protein